MVAGARRPPDGGAAQPSAFRALSAKHERISQLRRLVGRRGSRAELGCVVVEGVKVLRAAIESGAELVDVYVDSGSDATVAEVEVLLGEARCGRWVLPEGTLAKVLDTVTPQPVAAVVRPSPVDFDDVIGETMRKAGLMLIGVDVRDPGNVGTIIRSAEASGATAVLLLGTCADAGSPKVVRASAGGAFLVPVLQDGAVNEVLHRARSAGVRLVGTTVDPAAEAHDVPGALLGPVAVLVGNEANGLQPSELPEMAWITIPMAGRAESLNVGMAAAVLCFEASRQRRSGGQEWST